MSLDERVLNLEKYFAMLTELARRADERMDDHDAAINNYDAAINNITVKIEALADAQIRTEEALSRLAGAQARTEAALAQTDERFNRLVDIVERYISEGRNGKSRE